MPPTDVAMPASSAAVARLLALEEQDSALWNRSRTAILLGKKVARDFRPYKWPLKQHGVLVSERTRPLSSVRAANASVLLCHSLLTQNCFEKSNLGTQMGQSFWLPLRPSQRVNRILGAPALWTSKGGLCASLRHQPSARATWDSYAFPCYSFPQHAAELRLEAARDPRQRWISKPSSGSQGQGIEVLSARALSTQLASRSALLHRVITPYLANPLLLGGRKWDLRSYVLITSVLPLRAYLFSEAIVRFAARPYGAESSARGAVLTNTFVGKQLLRGGVAELTSTLAELGAALAPAGLPLPALLDAMRLAVGRLLLTCEPRVAAYYRALTAARRGAGAGAAEPPDADPDGFGCRNCYHVFGVDLIADARLQLRVIEVNVSPDLTLSAGRSGASAGYDDIKRAVGWNAVQTVFARESAAARLAAILARAAPALRARAPRLLAAAAGGGNEGGGGGGAAGGGALLRYLLGAVREGRALGCFAPVYPSGAAHAPLAAHLRQLSKAPGGGGGGGGGGGEAFDFAARWETHELLHLLLHSGDGAPAWRPPYAERCAQMLRAVARRHSPKEPKPKPWPSIFGFSLGGTDDDSDDEATAWARRGSIFRQLPQLQD